VWNNLERENKRTAGRYYATREAKTPVVYYQDDDVLVPRSTQMALLDAYEPGIPTAVYAHGDTPGGYDDVMLVGAGALVPAATPWQALNRYLDFYPIDDGFHYDCDFIAGTLYPLVKQVRLPFEIELAVAQHHSRLCNQTFQEDLKFDVTQRARALRDMVKVRAA
jgi:hypothetical protein